MNLACYHIINPWIRLRVNLKWAWDLARCHTHLTIGLVVHQVQRAKVLEIFIDPMLGQKAMFAYSYNFNIKY